MPPCKDCHGTGYYGQSIYKNRGLCLACLGTGEAGKLFRYFWLLVVIVAALAGFYLGGG